ncbi:MAG: prepilin-type N-terminal cleavage/methylation domain-containing protein [bacterium]
MNQKRVLYGNFRSLYGAGAGRPAFTLIELLIVVAIIGILAAIAVPNFMNARVRAKVARTYADMRSFQMAIDMYQMDNQAFPWTDKNPYGAQPIELRWICMTTPIAYVSSIPVDPFGDPPGAEVARGQGYAYTTYDFWCAREPDTEYPHWGWVRDAARAVGKELNRVITPPSNGAYFFVSQGPDQMTYAGSGKAMLYDVTNGLVSYGDIVRGGPGGLTFN